MRLLGLLVAQLRFVHIPDYLPRLAAVSINVGSGPASACRYTGRGTRFNAKDVSAKSRDADAPCQTICAVGPASGGKSCAICHPETMPDTDMRHLPDEDTGSLDAGEQEKGAPEVVDGQRRAPETWRARQAASAGHPGPSPGAKPDVAAPASGRESPLSGRRTSTPHAVHANPVRRALPTSQRRVAPSAEAMWPAKHDDHDHDIEEDYGWPSPPAEPARVGSLPWLDWKFSLILPIALTLVLATILWQITNQRELVRFSVQDSSTGNAIAGAQVQIGTSIYETNEAGGVTIERPGESSHIRVSADGYVAATNELGEDASEHQVVSLRPSSLIGQLVDSESGAPIEGASVSVFTREGSLRSTTRTDKSGAYRLEDVPEDAVLQVDAGAYGTHTQEVGDRLSLDIALVRTTAEGVVMDENGEPVQGAVVSAGDAMAVTSADGTFRIDGVRDGSELTITASGYERSTASVSDGRIADVALTPQVIKAVYANNSLLGTPGGLESLVEIANATEINAIVIDVKQDTVYFDSQVQFFQDAGTVRPIYDLETVLTMLDEHDIYAIARLVVFQDPLVAKARPDLAVHDVNGGLWVNVDGVAWVSAFNEELWDANIELAVEVINRGFDEVQYDYVRFPSDGDLSTADFGREYTADARQAAITEFMKRSHKAVNAAGGFLAADLFGFITLVDDEQNIGQRFSLLEPHLDYVCMMIYPSHFETGNIASAPGHPNDHPYETILESLQRAEALVPGSSAKFRPWLQDFSYGYNGLRDYTPDDVRAQIDAAEDFGTSGWMLWGDPFDVTVEALEPDPGA